MANANAAVARLNQELAKLVDPGGNEMEYMFAIYDLEDVSPESVTRNETLLMAADQMYICVESSGLFSYFELQGERAQDGIEALNLIELPKTAGVLTDAFKALGLPDNASAEVIRERTSEIVGPKFEIVLDQMGELESRYYNSGESIETAIGVYAKRNVGSLVHHVI